MWSLVQAGVYYSDEYAVFDESGYVCPFALPISLRLNYGERTIIMPDRIGSSPLQADLIVFTRYRPGAVWRPRRLDRPNDAAAYPALDCDTTQSIVSAADIEEDQLTNEISIFSRETVAILSNCYSG